MRDYRTEKQDTSQTESITFTEANCLGERIVVDLTKCENSGGKNSLPELWKAHGYLDRVLPDYWSVNTYVTDTDGNCTGKYNPQIGSGGNIDFAWMLEATEENRERLLEEIDRRVYAREYAPPMVKILHSESPQLKEGMELPFLKASQLLESLDQAYTDIGYDKTEFQITYVREGELHTYQGRYDIGSEREGLLWHIRSNLEAPCRFYETQIAASEKKGISINVQKYREKLQEHQKVERELVPYLQMHCNLSLTEMLVKERFGETCEHGKSVLDYIRQCRMELNTGKGEQHFQDLSKNITDFAAKSDNYLPMENDMSKTDEASEQMMLRRNHRKR